MPLTCISLCSCHRSQWLDYGTKQSGQLFPCFRWALKNSWGTGYGIHLLRLNCMVEILCKEVFAELEDSTVEAVSLELVLGIGTASGKSAMTTLGYKTGHVYGGMFYCSLSACCCRFSCCMCCSNITTDHLAAFGYGNTQWGLVCMEQ